MIKIGILGVVLQGGIGIGAAELITATGTSTSDLVEVTRIICALVGSISTSYFSYQIYVNAKKTLNEKINKNQLDDSDINA